MSTTTTTTTTTTTPAAADAAATTTTSTTTTTTITTTTTATATIPIYLVMRRHVQEERLFEHLTYQFDLTVLFLWCNKRMNTLQHNTVSSKPLRKAFDIVGKC